MKVHDLSMTIEWAAREGWNPAKHDLKAFFAADPNGFFIGEYEGNPVATISAVAYDAHYGFVGFYIVHPDFRGRGFGLQLWNHGLSYLGTRTVGLDGVVAQQANYKRSGFALAYRNIRFERKGTLPPLEAPTPESNCRLVDARILPFPLLRDFDRHFFPAKRDAFLTHWLQQPDATALAYIVDDTIDGYGMIRPARDGYRIGPLFARSETTAFTLLEALAAQALHLPIYWDVPEPNAAAVKFAKRHGFTPGFETARMYKGTAPTLDTRDIYGVTSLELG